MHPPSIPAFPGSLGSQLQPGSPAAHSSIRLPLLPSGPGGVWRAWVAQDLIFDVTHPILHRKTKNLGWEFDPGIADSGLQGTANSPSSTRKFNRRLNFRLLVRSSKFMAKPYKHSLGNYFIELINALIDFASF